MEIEEPDLENENYSIEKLVPEEEDFEEKYDKLEEYVFKTDKNGNLKYSFGGLIEPRKRMKDKEKVLETLGEDGKLSVFLALNEDDELIGTYWSKEIEKDEGKRHQGHLHVRKDHEGEGIATNLIRTRDKENPEGMKVLRHTATFQEPISRIAEKLGYTLKTDNSHIKPETANEEQLLKHTSSSIRENGEIDEKTRKVLEEKGLKEELKELENA